MAARARKKATNGRAKPSTTKTKAAREELLKATQEGEQRVVDRVNQVLEEEGYTMMVGVLHWEGMLPTGLVRYVPKP
jgi:Skp family chaperone for outer membrane proteins